MMKLPLFDPSRRHAALAAGLVLLAMLIGGGGSPSPAAELWLELLAGIVAALWLWQRGPLRLPASRSLWLVAGIALALPLMQLVPLPPSIWHALPGRDVEAGALALVGADNTWRPLSMSPARTLASLLAMTVPVIVLLMTGALSYAERRWLTAAVALGAVLSALFGAVQLAAGETGARIYEKSPEAMVIGFQANRNSAADVMLIGLAALAAVWAAWPKRSERAPAGSRRGWIYLCLALLLALACVLTRSRAGTLLLIPTLAAASAMALSGRDTAWRRALPKAAAAAFVLLGAGFALLRHNAALQKVAERFEDGSGREELWTDTLYAIGQYWPFGSGMGTFVPSFIAFEPLEAVDPSVPNRAHNDFLELLLEAGAFGAAALAIVAALIAFMAIRAWRSRPLERGQIGFGLVTLAIIAVHSVVDYPLRSISLACLAALAVGLLAAPPVREPAGARP